MKKSSWKKFFTKSRSKSGSRSKKGLSTSEQPNENVNTSGVSIENNEPIVQKLVAEKPLEDEAASPVSIADQDTGPSLKQASRMNSSTSQPRSSTNEDFMAEEVESQVSSVNSQASQKPATVTDLDQDVAQTDSATMVRHPAFSESVPSNDVLDSEQTTKQSSLTEQVAPTPVADTEMIPEPTTIQAENAQIHHDIPTNLLMVEEPASVDRIGDPEETDRAPTVMPLVVQPEEIRDENQRTASNDEEEFAVDRSQPQQLSKLDVLGTELQINPNHTESDESQKPMVYNITNNFVTTDYQPSETETQETLSDRDASNCANDTAAVILELPVQLLNKDECASRDAESLRGAEMLFFSGVTSSGLGPDNLTPILFFGPQADNFVEEKIVYQVANESRTTEDDSYDASRASLSGSRNDGQSPPTLEDENEDHYNFKDIVKKM